MKQERVQTQDNKQEDRIQITLPDWFSGEFCPFILNHLYDKPRNWQKRKIKVSI